MKQETQISKRLKELKEIYAPLTPDKMSLALPLIENAVFIEFRLKDLQEIIATEGCTEEYQNGKCQFGTKQSASVQSYNALVKSYNMINQRLEAMLPPKQKSVSKLEELKNE